MSGCAHMNPDDFCASCAGEKLRALRESIKVTMGVNVNLGAEVQSCHAALADALLARQKAEAEAAALRADHDAVTETLKMKIRHCAALRAERDRLRESRDGMLREAVRALEHWLAKGAKVVWPPYLMPSACRELLRAAGFYGADQLEHARAALASGEESRDPASAEPAEEPGR